MDKEQQKEFILNGNLWKVLFDLSWPAVFMGMTFFPSINKGSVASVVAILRQVLLYIPAMLIVPRFFGLAGIYYAIFCIEILCIAGMLVMVKREFHLLRTGVTKWQTVKN